MWQKSGLAVLVLVVAGIALVERLLAEPPDTLDDEIDAIAAALPKYEEARSQGFAEVLDRLAYNHLSSLGREGVARIIERIRQESDETVATLANVLAFYEYKGEHVMEIAGLAANGSGAIRTHAVWLLGVIPESLQHAEILALVARSAEDKDWRVRRAAALSLPRLGWPGADAPLAALLADPDARVAEIASLAAQFIAAPVRFDATARALADTVLGEAPRGTRLYAARSLVELTRGGGARTPRVMQALRAMAESDLGDTAEAARALLKTTSTRPSNTR